MNSTRNRSYRSLFRVAVISVFYFSIPAFSAQNMYVKPMVIEVSPYPGMRMETDLELRNASDQTQSVQFSLCELTQGRNAVWKIIEEGGETDKDVKADKTISCYDWISLSESKITVAPKQAVKIKVRLKIPPTAKGFYLAGIVATLSPTESPGGVGFVVRFLVPVLVDIRARAQVQKLTLTDVGMKFRPDSANLPATTFLTMSIANEGKTYSSVEGNAMLKKKVGDDWRRISDVKFRKTKVIPGVEVDLEADIEKSLPSGQYKLFGQCKIGGRRAKPLEKLIEFVGDPTITSAATDAAIEVQPGHITIETMQGATRNTLVQVSNASESGEVEVYATVEIPEAMKGGSLGTLRSEEMTCPDWLTVRPDKFTIRSGSRQNIQIISKVPDTEMAHANYYAFLNLRSRYLTGQSAGKGDALICVHNKNLASEPKGQVMNLTLSAEKASRYIVTGLFGNVGNIHFSPKCYAVVRDSKGMKKISLGLKGDSDSMFPLETRSFSEVIDFSSFTVGLYSIEAIMDYGSSKVATGRLSIRVSSGDKWRVVEIVAPE